MRLNIIFLAILFIISGCTMGPATYEVFEQMLDANVGKPISNTNPRLKEIYSEDKYIYKRERPKGCHFGFLTNRDDKPEKVIGWIILSGKEYCKEQQAYAF